MSAGFRDVLRRLEEAGELLRDDAGRYVIRTEAAAP